MTLLLICRTTSSFCDSSAVTSSIFQIHIQSVICYAEFNRVQLSTGWCQIYNCGKVAPALLFVLARVRYPSHLASTIAKDEPSGTNAPTKWNRSSACLNSIFQSSLSRSRALHNVNISISMDLSDQLALFKLCFAEGMNNLPDFPLHRQRGRVRLW